MDSPIIVVSGLPRSGTSLMMQLLGAAGVPLITDTHRPADESNPRGYFEDARVKSLASNVAWLSEARGQAVKIVAPLVPFLPAGFKYRVLFMQRDLGATLRSQQAMLQRLGAGIAWNETVATNAAEVQIAAAKAILQQLPETAVLMIDFHELLREPVHFCLKILQFIDVNPSALTSMIAVIDPHLERNQPTSIPARSERLE